MSESVTDARRMAGWVGCLFALLGAEIFLVFGGELWPVGVVYFIAFMRFGYELIVTAPS